MKLKLLPKFILSLCILGMALSVIISIFSYANSKNRLEDMYAYRVTFGSHSIAAMLPVEDVRTIISEGGNQSEAYHRTAALLAELKQAGHISFLSLVVPHEDSVTFYIDTCVEEMGDDPAAQIPYGSNILYTDAANDEKDLDKYYISWDLYAQNLGTDSPLITDNSYGYNFTSVSPVLDENGQAIAAIQYILDMNQVRWELNSFLLNMLLISICIMGIAIICYVMFVRKVVTTPIGRLVKFTRQITVTGKFKDHSIDIETGDEIEDLGSAFNYMLQELEKYIENLSKVTAEKERIGAELNVAAQIQADMLPNIFPALPERSEFDIYATMTPAKEVGGDFYDFFMVDHRHLAIVIADVSGKGVPAALFMVIGKTLIKDHTRPGISLGDVFSEVNDLLCQSNSEGLFITAFEGVLDLVTGQFSFVNAGHEMPFLSRAGGAYEPYKIRPGFVLAGMEGMQYQSGMIQLAPGDKIFQYTDGVTEATNRDNELYGMERLTKILCQNTTQTPTALLPAVKEDVDAFVGDAPQFDDITMLCVEYRARMEEDVQ